jgi:hypothetical protein
MDTAAFQTIGVVEGFYGHVWSEAEREAFLTGIAPFGLNTYLYAPKHDVALGARLLEPLDKGASQRLHRLHHFCERRGIALWAGLHLEPPFDPAEPGHLDALLHKARQLAQVGVQGLAVLCDDLPPLRPPRPGDPFGGSQAAAQAHTLVALRDGLARQGGVPDWLLCPARYTLDPLLEREYGAFEPDYLARLHAALPREVSWLWTGPRVCSRGVTPRDVAHYFAAAGIAADERPLVLWDNYPVNDASMRGRLHLGPLTGRDAALPRHVQGYLFNPLLQAHLGTLPGATCLRYANDPPGYDPTAAWREALEASLPAALHGPVSELAALTRPAKGLETTTPGRLSQRLLAAWDALSRGDPIEPYLLVDLRRVLSQLEQGLPEAMRAEAAPWLGRLWRALRLIEATGQGAPPEALGPLRAEFAEWHDETPLPEVLGPWFP